MTVLTQTQWKKNNIWIKATCCFNFHLCFLTDISSDFLAKVGKNESYASGRWCEKTHRMSIHLDVTVQNMKRYFNTGSIWLGNENTYMISRCFHHTQSKYVSSFQNYLWKCKDTYIILKNKYLCIKEDSFRAKILRDYCILVVIGHPDAKC